MGPGELTATGAKTLLAYGTGGTIIGRAADGAWNVTAGQEAFRIANRDFDVLSFRNNAVVRGQWRPGSTMFLVWQQNRAGTRPPPPTTA